MMNPNKDMPHLINFITEPIDEEPQNNSLPEPEDMRRRREMWARLAKRAEDEACEADRASGGIKAPDERMNSRWRKSETDLSAHPKRRRESNVPVGSRFVNALVGFGLSAVALLLFGGPVLLKHREAMRRMQCTNNLKYIALACHNYESANNVFPPGALANMVRDSNGVNNELRANFSYLLAASPNVEAVVVYNALNSVFDINACQNLTVNAMVPSVFWCPSDPEVSQVRDIYGHPAFAEVCGNRPLNMGYTSYLGSTGPWFPMTNSQDLNDPNLRQYVDNQMGTIIKFQLVSSYRIADGTSNTLLLSESAYGKLDQADRIGSHWWTSPNYGDTMFTTRYPMNPKLKDSSDRAIFTQAASSFHPGGANFAMGDGSVKFIKNSISLPAYRALSTRAGGEIISSDQY